MSIKDPRLSKLVMPRRRFLTSAAALGVASMGAGAFPRLAFGQDEPEKPAEIIVRAWGGVWMESLAEGVSKPFEEATGIRVRHDLTEDNEMQPRIWAAVAQNRTPPIHVNWDTSTNATQSALRGVCDTLTPDMVPNLEGLLPAAQPTGFDGAFPIVNCYSYVYVLAYRDEAFPDGPPESWDVMLDPRFRGRVALYNDGIGFEPVSVVMGGGSMDDIPDNMEPAWEFYRQLREQQPLLGEDPDFTNWFQRGEIDVACTIISNARAAKQAGIPVSWTVPREGAKYDTDALWVPAGLPDNEAYWAKQYVNAALAPENMENWCSMLGLPPLRAGLEGPEDLVGDPAYPTTEEDFARLLNIPTPILVEHQSDWFAQFRDIMQS
ncbi:ABC transporter substrate-binding protein [Pelagibacterium montanilacus]|uniref:ABC transporter substrate-binding protein n=1 Tax=Pelagibacterium montanilacus TaxID=2185280 RepID=UPI0019D00FA1|nr:PotD/PotF family extracellular solute-binding protein [Pelagibacterium montanilacus]